MLFKFFENMKVFKLTKLKVCDGKKKKNYRNNVINGHSFHKKKIQRTLIKRNNVYTIKNKVPVGLLAAESIQSKMNGNFVRYLLLTILSSY